jgi:hypothetical protein
MPESPLKEAAKSVLGMDSLPSRAPSAAPLAASKDEADAFKPQESAASSQKSASSEIPRRLEAAGEDSAFRPAEEAGRAPADTADSLSAEVAKPQDDEKSGASKPQETSKAQETDKPQEMAKPQETDKRAETTGPPSKEPKAAHVQEKASAPGAAESAPQTLGADVEPESLPRRLKAGKPKEHGNGRASSQPDPPSKRSALNGLALGTLGDSPKDLDAFLEALPRKLAEAKEILSKRPEGEKALEAASKALDRLELLAETKSMAAVQLPVSLNGAEAPAELYVFKDKAKKGGPKASSALLALDTAHLGRFEAYLQKTGSSVSATFRLEGKDVETLVSIKHERLATLLEDAGLSLSSISFRPLEKPFTILSVEEELLGRKGSGPFALDAKV